MHHDAVALIIQPRATEATTSECNGGVEEAANKSPYIALYLLDFFCVLVTDDRLTGSFGLLMMNVL